MTEATVRRYQVRAPSKTWADPGPDLLRPLDDALTQARKVVKDGIRFTSRRRDDGSWSPWKPVGRGDLEGRLQRTPDDEVIRLADDKREPRAYVRAQDVPLVGYVSATAGAILDNALMRQAHPTTEFAGIFVCKGIAGTNLFSDHAWGDAVDRSHGDTDALFDWCVRMAAAGLMEAAYVIGPRNGSVVSASAPDWEVRQGGGDDTHLWHVHLSVRKHSGRPPCA